MRHIPRGGASVEAGSNDAVLRGPLKSARPQRANRTESPPTVAAPQDAGTAAGFSQRGDYAPASSRFGLPMNQVICPA